MLAWRGYFFNILAYLVSKYFSKTRLPTPRIDADDEDELAMSSGDESDNADLTEGGSSDDDWSSGEEGLFIMPTTHLGFHLTCIQVLPECPS